MIGQLWQDFRYGVRVLVRHRGFTVAAVFSLALGIGLSTAIYSVTYSVLLHAIPFPEPERLVSLWLTNSAAAAANVPRFNTNAGNWIDWRSQSGSFEDIALTRAVSNFNLTVDGPPQRVQGGRTTWNLPEVLSVQPMLGRMFTQEEARRDARVVVISFGLWQRRFGGTSDVVGRPIQLNDESFDVIGVMPSTFQYPSRDFELWTPLFITPEEIRSQYAFNYRAVGRLKPGVTIEQAQSETTAITRHWAQQFPAGPNAGQYGVLVESLLDSRVGQFRSVLYILLCSVGCLLLIGCINLGGLLVVRASSRAREFAIRAALGASPARLYGQTLAETLPLSFVGSVAGIVLARWLLKLLLPLLPSQLPGLETIGLNSAVLFFAVAVSFGIVWLAGMLPAVLASRIQLATMTKQSGRTFGSGSGGLTRNVLVVAQLATTLVLVIAGGLLVRSLVTILRVNPGFSPSGVLTLQLALTRSKYPTDSQVTEYYRRIISRVRSIAGVRDAGMINILPFSELRTVYPVEFAGKTDQGAAADGRSVMPGYFSTMGIPLIRGRDFSEQDREGTTPVGIIDEQLAIKIFGENNPVGERFRFGVMTATTPWLEIIGVVGHIRNDSLDSDPRPQVYWPESQPASDANRPYKDRAVLVVAGGGRPVSLASAVVEQIQIENPDQPVYDVRSMEDWLDKSLQSRNLVTGLVMLFGCSSLLLAFLGLYGVLSYGALLRMREFAIRTALGAKPGAIRRLVLGHAIRLWVLGSGIGLCVAWVAGRAVGSLLYGVGSSDPLTMAAALILLLGSAMIAGLGPARKAERVDPAVTLRSE